MKRLGPDSVFDVAPPSGEPSVTIDSHRAAELAELYARRFGHFNRSLFEQGHGSPIDFEGLTAEPRVYYASSPYGAVDQQLSGPAKKSLAGYYLVTLDDQFGPVLSVAVSAIASDLAIRNGKIIPPAWHGNEFRVIAIAPGQRYPIPPEQAARLASEGTGGLVTATPLLIRAPAGSFSPNYARWRVVVRSSPSKTKAFLATKSSGDTVYVNWNGALSRGSQVGTSEKRTLTYAAPFSGTATQKSGVQKKVVDVPLRPGFANRFSLIASPVRIR